MKLSKMVIGFAVTSLLLFQLFLSSAVAEPVGGFNDSGLKTGDRATAGFVLGATTIDGVNYQQVGIRADIPLGKLGIGLDLQILLDEEGNVREEDWDDTEDYFNMIYYIRWDHKGAPFYTKIGGLDYSYIGYSNIVNGYSNMIEYPDYKRIGMEMDVNLKNFRAELLINDYKELTAEEPSMVVATRLAYKIGGKLEIGVTAASDLNEYNGFKDNDDDGFPNEIDDYPNDNTYVTHHDMLLDVGMTETEIDRLIELQPFEDIRITEDTRETLSAFDFTDKNSDLTILGLDIGYPIIQGDFLKMDLYAAYADILDYGWGITAPGFRTMLGDIFTFTAEYRIQSKEFLYGYFNQTYELERAEFFTPDGASSYYQTKQDKLTAVTDDMSGYLVGAYLNLQGYVAFDAKYQQMDADNDDQESKSLYGEVILNNNKIAMLPKVKGYYAQNNVVDFDEWKTPSTVTGAIIQMTVGSATLSFNHRYTFADVNGDGEIKGQDETIKTLSISSTVTF